MNKSAQILCPNCARKIDVSEVLYQQLQSELSMAYEQKYSDQRKDLEDSIKRLAGQKLKLM